MKENFYSTDKELHEYALQRKRQGYRHYSETEIRLIVTAHLKNKVPISALSEKYSVHPVTIWRWISKFAELKDEDLSDSPVSDTKSNKKPMPRKKQNPVESPEEELARLREENKQLQEALKMAEWSNHAKDVMIDIAEKTFNIPIRKKPGAKQ